MPGCSVTSARRSNDTCSIHRRGVAATLTRRQAEADDQPALSSLPGVPLAYWYHRSSARGAWDASSASSTLEANTALPDDRLDDLLPWSFKSPSNSSAGAGSEKAPNAEPVTVSAVHIVETAPPEDEKPVQWSLLTSLDVRTAGDAAGIVGFYLQRWRVEDWFRVLNSGCRVEHLLFRTADRLQRAVAINAVIAWRIMLMTLLGREVPDCDPELMYTDAELAFLRDYARKHGMAGPVRLGDAVGLVAHLGGYRDRTHDPDPGNQIMWTGCNRLSSAAPGHEIGREVGHEVGYDSGFADGRNYALRQSK